MSAKSIPEITFELDTGNLTIRTAEAVYHVVVTGTGAGAGRGALPAAAAAPQLAAAEDDWDLPEPDDQPAPAPAAAPPALEAGEGDQEFYRELSAEMYHEVGRLAKRLSMSIRDVKQVKVDALDPSDAGQKLESAKDQLEGVVKMTERATMLIIENSERIQDDIDRASKIMSEVSSASASGGQAAEPDPEAEANKQALSTAVAALSEFAGRMADSPLEALTAQAQEVLDELNAAPAAAPAPEPEPAPAAKWSFPLELVFQTVYELCTNETVKKHIKAMWDSGDQGFDQAAVESALNALAPAEPDEDNFLNLDLKGVLKGLFQATGQERFQAVLKKMAGTADQIFLEQSLPLEAVPSQAAPAEAPAAPAPAADAPAADTAKLEALIDALKNMSQSLTPPEVPENLAEMLEAALAAGGDGAGGGQVPPELIEQLGAAMDSIFQSVNRIIEALSFQDLSGQAIYGIVRLLTDFQVQLLAMVVSFGTKIKAKETQAELSAEASEKMAQSEVDRVLDSLGVSDAEGEGGAAEEERGSLDQDQVNNMLEGLGF